MSCSYRKRNTLEHMKKLIPFALPDIGDEEINAVVDTMKSGWITTGPKTKEFERDFEETVGGGVEAVAVNSATAGLHLALEAIGIEQGDVVVTTPYTFTATAEVIRYLGADPLFVDIDSNTFNLDPNKIDAVLSDISFSTRKRKIKAIVPVHFAGLACDMGSILKMAQGYDLRVIEDAAHALPTTYKRSLIGTLQSDATVFSFYATKTVTTGEGGMIVTRNKDIASRCRTMRLHGINRDVFNRYVSTSADWRYEVIAPGFKYNMTDIAAALGIVQLKKALVLQKKRNQMASRYNEAFEDLPLILPKGAEDGDIHAWHLYVIRLMDDAKVSRDRFIEMMAKKGIGCSVHFIPLHLHPYWRDRYNLKPEDYPNALKAYEKAVSLPLYTKMSENDQLRVIDAVREILK